tara:strand:- start:61 stop:270 length:210 start_codon:yes stop_codon:yes gene_type:complete
MYINLIKINHEKSELITQKVKDPILYLSVLLALGAIFTTISLFENDDDDDDGDGDNILSFPAFEFVKAF